MKLSVPNNIDSAKLERKILIKTIPIYKFRSLALWVVLSFISFCIIIVNNSSMKINELFNITIIKEGSYTGLYLIAFLGSVPLAFLIRWLVQGGINAYIESDIQQKISGEGDFRTYHLSDGGLRIENETYEVLYKFTKFLNFKRIENNLLILFKGKVVAIVPKELCNDEEEFESFVRQATSQQVS